MLTARSGLSQAQSIRTMDEAVRDVWGARARIVTFVRDRGGEDRAGSMDPLRAGTRSDFWSSTAWSTLRMTCDETNSPQSARSLGEQRSARNERVGHSGRRTAR